MTQELETTTDHRPTTTTVPEVDAVDFQPQLPGRWPVSLVGISAGEAAAAFERNALDRQLGRVDRDENLRFLAEVFAGFDLRTRLSIVARSTSIVNALEVFANDPSPLVRSALAHNRHFFDTRIQWKLARDTDPLVALTLLESADIDARIVDWLIDECPFDLVRARLARKRISFRYLKRLALDVSPLVSAVAVRSIAHRWPDRLKLLPSGALRVLDTPSQAFAVAA